MLAVCQHLQLVGMKVDMSALALFIDINNIRDEDGLETLNLEQNWDQQFKKYSFGLYMHRNKTIQ